MKNQLRFRFPDGELDAWAVLGHVTDRSVRVWARTRSGSVEAVMSVEGEEAARQRIDTDPERDHVGAAVLEADRSRPGSEFKVTVGGQTLAGWFAPAADEPASFRFAFGSCHQPFTEPMDGGRLDKHAGAAIYPNIHRVLQGRGAAFAMWLGDQVYSDAISRLSVRETMSRDPSVTDDDLVEAYRHLYRGYFNEHGHRGLAEAFPAYLMWDDHDIFDGWGSLLDHTEFDERVYRAAQRAFVEYQQLRNPGGAPDRSPPFGYSFWVGDVGFHVPDLRSERDFGLGRVMGEAGWKLLDAFLAEAAERDVPTVFIGASVPVVHASPALMGAMERMRNSYGRDVRDRWSVSQFAAERTKLVERLFEWQSGAPRRQVIVLSGDVHVGAAFSVRPRRGRGHFAQWTSSALSTPDGLGHVVANMIVTRFVRAGERELRVWRKGLATSNNVGLVDVQPADGGGHVVRLTVYAYDARRDTIREALTDIASPG